MTAAEKDTIYIDVDDEITNIIDKVTTSKHKIVAVVLPKRATVLQSIVNMKLLKRSVVNAKKHIVLITSEAGLLPLAGAVGLHVAKNLQSKPAIPAGPERSEIPDSLVDEDEIEAPEEPELDAAKSVGELAGPAASAAAGAAAAQPEPEAEIELDNDDLPAAADSQTAKKSAKPGGKAGKGAKSKAKSKDGKLKVPNFDRFRKWLIFGGLALVLLLIFGYLAIFRWPKATIAIDTDSSQLNTKLSFTADTTTKDFDKANGIIPAEWATTTKSDDQTIAATGQQNNGNKATGSVKMTVQQCNGIVVPASVPAGSGVSAGGLTYITQSDTSFSYDHISGGCIYFKSSSTAITAQNGGANYNTSGSTDFSVAGRSDVSATGSANGGTDNIVKVVSQADIDGAKSKFTAPNADDIKQQLISQLQKDGLTAIDSSFKVDGPNISSSVKAGDQADSFVATASTKYSILGVNQTDLKKYVDSQIKGQINTKQQAILSNGLKQAEYSVGGTGESPKVTIQTTAVIGPNLDTDSIKREIAGKKRGEARDIIENRPSIKSATVKYSPFWVTKAPSNPDKIVITFDKADDQD